MAKSLEEQLESVEKELKAESDVWEQKNLPFIGQIYRMGENEFMHHVHVLSLDRLMRRVLSNVEVDLEIKRMFLEEMRSARKLAEKLRSETIRQQLVDGVGIIKPPPPQG